MTVVDTFRAVRRLDLGDYGFREHGQLVPEAITWFSYEHLLHTGEIEDAKGIEEAEFRAAVQDLCPHLADQIWPLVGLSDGVHLESNRDTPRSASMVPVHVSDSMTPETLKRAPRKRTGRTTRPAAVKRAEVTIQATDVPPGTRTPGT